MISIVRVPQVVGSSAPCRSTMPAHLDVQRTRFPKPSIPHSLASSSTWCNVDIMCAPDYATLASTYLKHRRDVSTGEMCRGPTCMTIGFHRTVGVHLVHWCIFDVGRYSSSVLRETDVCTCAFLCMRIGGFRMLYAVAHTTWRV